MMELYEQRYPFREASSTHVDLSMEFQSIEIERYMAETGYPKVMAEFLLKTLQTNPQYRPEASALLQSNWFQFMGIYDLDHATEALREWLKQFNGCIDTEKNIDYRVYHGDKNSPESVEFDSCKESESMRCDGWEAKGCGEG